MGEKGFYSYSINGVCNCIKGIILKDITIKNSIFYYLIKSIMSLIVVKGKELKAAELFGDDNSRADNPNTHMEAAL